MTGELSYVHGASDVPLLGETIGAHFDRSAARWPDRTALVVREQGVRWSYAELDAQVDAFAAGLLALGLEPGDRVGIWSPNNAEWVVTQFATAKAGLILVNINPAYRTHELDYALNKVGCRALVTAHRASRPATISAMLRELAPELAAAPGAAARCRLTVIQIGGQAPGYHPLRRDRGHRHRRHARAPRRAGGPAAVRRSDQHPVHQRHHGRAQGCDAHPPQHPQQRLLHRRGACGSAPTTRSASRCRSTTASAWCWATSPASPTARPWSIPAAASTRWPCCRPSHEERCTALYGVPTMFIAELDHPEFASLRPLHPAHRHHGRLALPDRGHAPGGRRDAHGRGHHRLRHDRDQPGQLPERAPTTRSSAASATVGRIQPHVEVKIVDAEGRIVPRGTPGELCTRGYSVMRGYWDDPERTAEAIDAAGWMHTGDLATIDAEGYCNIVGRIKDMVIRGGENIYPREIEEFLYGHPDDARRAVLRRADPKFGEELCAWIILKDGAEADRGRDPRLLRGQDRPLQDPALHPLRRRLPDDRHRQGAEVRAQGRDGGRAGAGGGADGVAAVHDCIRPPAGRVEAHNTLAQASL